MCVCVCVCVCVRVCVCVYRFLLHLELQNEGPVLLLDIFLKLLKLPLKLLNNGAADI